MTTEKRIVRLALALLVPLVLSLVPYLIFVIQLGVDIAPGLFVGALYLLFGSLYFFAGDYLSAVISWSISMFLLGLWTGGFAILVLAAGMWLLSLYFKILRL